MDLGLAGRVALVTASSSGIGMNVARPLAQEGAHIALFARSSEKLDALASSMRHDYGIEVVPVPGSMLERGDIDRLFDAIEKMFGRLDVAVLNTGRPPTPLRDAINETEKARWDISYETLLLGVIQISQRACLLMARN